MGEPLTLTKIVIYLVTVFQSEVLNLLALGGNGGDACLGDGTVREIKVLQIKTTVTVCEGSGCVREIGRVE